MGLDFRQFFTAYVMAYILLTYFRCIFHLEKALYCNNQRDEILKKNSTYTNFKASVCKINGLQKSGKESTGVEVIAF